MAYQTLCDRFSTTTTVNAGLSTGILSFVALNLLTHGNPNLTFIGGFLGAWSGVEGWRAGVKAEKACRNWLREKHVGVARGSRILQGTELTAYGAVLMVALGADHAFNTWLLKETPAPSASGPDKTMPIPATTAPLPAPAPSLS